MMIQMSSNFVDVILCDQFNSVIGIYPVWFLCNKSFAKPEHEGPSKKDTHPGKLIPTDVNLRHSGFNQTKPKIQV